MTTFCDETDQRTALTREWNLNRPNERGVCLQDEFGGDEEAFIAFKEHEQAGHITVCGTNRVRPPERRPVNRSVLFNAALAAGERRWATDASLRAQFGGDKANFDAYSRAEAGGFVRIRGARRGG